jgi:hypothetical protein
MTAPEGVPDDFLKSYWRLNKIGVETFENDHFLD